MSRHAQTDTAPVAARIPTRGARDRRRAVRPDDGRGRQLPTLNFVPGRGLRVALSMDAGPARVIDILPEGYSAENGNEDWERSVMNNARHVRARFEVAAPGYHTLRVWMVDPAVVVQKIVVTTPSAAPQETCLGPPESFRSSERRPGLRRLRNEL